jgi:hypothetical protein
MWPDLSVFATLMALEKAHGDTRAAMELIALERRGPNFFEGHAPAPQIEDGFEFREFLYRIRRRVEHFTPEERRAVWTLVCEYRRFPKSAIAEIFVNCGKQIETARATLALE